MKVNHAIKLGSWGLVILNILMAFAAIWVFVRMTPAIEKIIQQNQRSLAAGENMLVALATPQIEPDDTTTRFQRRSLFLKGLQEAQQNITELGEKEQLSRIDSSWELAIHGDSSAIVEAISAIQELLRINRSAMALADQNARRLGNSGAWIIIAMTGVIFLIGLLYIYTMNSSILSPLAELNAVFTAQARGDTLRRCNGNGYSADIKALFRSINALLDRHMPSK